MYSALLSPRSSMDRTQASGACNVGSTPAGGTNFIFLSNVKYFQAVLSLI